MKEFFLIVSRLVPQKRIDIAVEAFNRLKLPLKIVGTGVEENRLKSMAKNNIKFLGNLTDEELAGYYNSCLAIIIPGEEDFNIVAVEAQSFGKPVIAFGAGGVTETVIAGKTGVFFSPQTSVALEQTIKKFKDQKFDENDCKTNARKFSRTRFHEEFRRMVERTQNFKKTS